MKLNLADLRTKIKIDKFLVIFMAIFAVKGVFYAAYAMPLTLDASADDTGHISYVIYLATEHKIPVMHEAKMEKTVLQNHHDAGHSRTEGKIYVVNTEEFEESSTLNWISQHPPLYYLYLSPFYLLTVKFTNILATIILVLRLATVLLGVVTIYFLYKALKLLGLKDLALKCAMVCVVFSSAIQFYLTAIDNDAMVICLSTAAFYFFIKYIKESNIKALYIFAALCGGITITKYTGAVVLPVYALVYLWDMIFIKKRNVKEIFRYSAICVLIFAVITAPVLAQNYSRYAVLFPIDSNSRVLNRSLTYFVTETGYIDRIFSRIIHQTGWTGGLLANQTELYLASLIVLCGYFLKVKTNIWLLIAPFLMAIVFLQIKDMSMSAALAVGAVLCMLPLALFDHRKGIMTFDREVCILAVSMLLFYVAVFLVQHYRMYVHYGGFKATHGRYYYPLIAPFFFLLFRKLDERKDKFIGLLPLALLLVNVGMETDFIFRGIQSW